jgi:dipeptidase E
VKLYLSSHDPQGIPADLTYLVGANRRTAIIANANDAEAADQRATGLAREVAELTSLGLLPEELDLRNYFGTTTLESKLREFGLIWVRGGNAFLLRRAMRYSGFDAVLPGLLTSSDLVYGGYSAGAVVAAPTLRGIDLIDDAHEIVPPYEPDVIWEGLGLIPFSIAPHFQSDYLFVDRVDDAVAYFEREKLPYRTLSDNQVIVIDGEVERILDYR